MAVNTRSKNIVRQVPMRTFTIDDETLRRMQNAQGDTGIQQGFTEAQKILSTDMSQRVLTVPADSEDVDIAITQLTNTLYNNLYALDARVTATESFVKGDISDDLVTQIANIRTSITGLNTSIAALNAQLTDISASIAEVASDLSTLNNRVTQINNSVTALDSRMSSAEASITTLTNYFWALDARVSALENPIEGP